MQNFILTTPSDLENLISVAVTDAVKEQLKNLTTQKGESEKNATTGEKLLTRKETALKLNVTLPTLTKYVKQGKIKSHRIGRRVLFKESDIINSITPKY